MGLNTTPRTWVPGELVTALELNTEIRDALTGIQAPWTTYTPAWTAATTNPTLNNGTLAGSYLQIGKTIHYRVRVVFGSTTAVGSGLYVFSLPVTAQGSYPVGMPMGNATIQNGGLYKSFRANLNTSTTVFLTHMSNDTNLDNTGPGSGWANGNIIELLGTYEAA